MTEPTPPIADLVRRARAGDLNAWTALVSEFQDVAAGLAAGWSGDWSTAEDIAQDAFVSAYLHLQDLDDPQAFPAWFKRVVHSAATRHARRGSHAPSTRPPAAPAADPVDAVTAADDAQPELLETVEGLTSGNNYHN